MTAGQLLDLIFGGFGPNTIVDVLLQSVEQQLGTFVADGSGVVSQSIQLPVASPGVHRLILEGTTSTGIGVTKTALIEYSGLPSVGESYKTYVCCFTTTGTELDPPDEVVVSLAGLELVTVPLDPQGGAVVEVPVPVNVGDPRLELDVVGTGETISPDVEVNPSAEGVYFTIQSVILDLEQEVASNPGAADKLGDAIAGLVVVLEELDKSPGDREAAAGNVEGAVGDLEAAVSDGVITTTFANTEMDLLSAAIRALTHLSINEAEARGGDPSKIAEAESLLVAGDTQRSGGEYKQAIATYKDAISKAEGA